jgi:isoquinoline 1-oxidoreductase alpha subunit
MKYTLSVNGARREVDVAPDTPLLWVLRDSLGLTGTKYACGIAQCGACTVYVGGRPTRSCVLKVESLGEREVTTIEALSGPAAEAVRASWDALQVPQCGYCQAGQVMGAVALLTTTPRPTDQDIDSALAGNLCRCATYGRIRRAVHDAAARLGR